MLSLRRPLAQPALFALLLSSLLLGFARVASADGGFVELHTGGRVNGEIVAVLPGDRAIVRLPDASMMTFPWSDVRRVQDGSRVYDSSGAITELATPCAELVEETGELPALLVNSSSTQASGALTPLPSRGGTIALGVFGGLFLTNATGLMLTAAFAGCAGESYYGFEKDCFGRNVMLGVGAGQFVLGTVMTIVTVKRHHRRERGLQERRARGLALDDTFEPRLSFDVALAPQRVVPSLTLRF